MTQFFAAFEDLFKSIYEMFASIIGTFASLINTIVSTILNFFSGIINLFTDVFKGVVDVVGGVGSFILSKLMSSSFTQVSTLRLTIIRQHFGDWSHCCGLCHLHSPATGQAHHSCEEDQLNQPTGNVRGLRE